MKNIEKYKEELKLEIKESNTFDCAIKSLRGGVCDENYLCTNCQSKSLDWLLEECEEECEKPNSILTDKEKAYLKNVIEPKRNDIAFIMRKINFEGRDGEHITTNVYVRTPYNSVFASRLLEFIVTKDMPFNGMELLKNYTLEELGL